MKHGMYRFVKYATKLGKTVFSIDSFMQLCFNYIKLKLKLLSFDSFLKCKYQIDSKVDSRHLVAVCKVSHHIHLECKVSLRKLEIK